MSEPKTRATDASVADFISALMREGRAHSCWFAYAPRCSAHG